MTIMNMYLAIFWIADLMKTMCYHFHFHAYEVTGKAIYLALHLERLFNHHPLGSDKITKHLPYPTKT